MSSAALVEAAEWAEMLMDAEDKGRKDREGLRRYRLARRLGIPESYLYRLQYKTREMSDVKGSVYRALMLEKQKVEDARKRHAAYREETARLASLAVVRSAARDSDLVAGQGSRLGGVDMPGNEG